MDMLNKVQLPILYYKIWDGDYYYYQLNSVNILGGYARG